MLVLSRRINEVLCIGDDAGVMLTILAIKGNQIKIGINAPKSIPVHRQEIFEKIKQKEQQLSESPEFEKAVLEHTIIEESSN